MVFSIEAVGTFTACTMKVIPNKAIITVTTADSKYSRMTVLGGPTGSASTSISRSRPLGRTDRAPKASGFSGVSCSLKKTVSLIGFIVDCAPHPVKRVASWPVQSLVFRLGQKFQAKACTLDFFTLHLFERSLRGGCFRGFD